MQLERDVTITIVTPDVIKGNIYKNSIDSSGGDNREQLYPKEDYSIRQSALKI